MKPLLVRSGLTNRVYVVTRYKRGPHGIVAETKHDVTDQFVDLAFEFSDDWWNEQADDR